jgi:integrase
MEHQVDFKKSWQQTLKLAGVPYFPYDLRSTHATRLSAGGVADEWVMQMLRQTDAKAFKKYSQMKLQMKRGALAWQLPSWEGLAAAREFRRDNARAGVFPQSAPAPTT